MCYNNVTKRNVTARNFKRTARMDQQAYHTFQILDHIEQTPLVTNRRVAGKLNVSVRLAHRLLTQLVQKGLLHIQKRHSRRWDYFLTPKGVAEKARLTSEFLSFTMQFYREARRRSAEVLAALKREGVESIAFLGVSELAEIAFLGVREHGLNLIEVFDEEKAGESFLGLTVTPLTGIHNTDAERILVTAFDPALPMGESFLPNGIPTTSENAAEKLRQKLMWVFTPARPLEQEDGNCRRETATDRHG